MESRERRDIISLILPLPPSVNRSFVARKGSARTAKAAAYRFWQQEVHDMHGKGEKLATLGTTPVSYGLWIDLSRNTSGDIDNRVKLISDVLCIGALGVVGDDKNMRRLYVNEQTGRNRNECSVTVVHMAHWLDYVLMRIL